MRQQGTPGSYFPLVADRRLGGGYTYPDTGCKVSAHCLSCPLSQCVFDAALPGTAMRAWQGDVYRSQVVALFAAGASRVQIQHQLGLSRSTVYRSLRAA